MKTINKKLNELYTSNEITVLVPYRGKMIKMPYVITGFYGTESGITATLKSKTFPCEVSSLSLIQLRVKNDFPTKKLIARIKKLKK